MKLKLICITLAGTLGFLANANGNLAPKEDLIKANNSKNTNLPGESKVILAPDSMDKKNYPLSKNINITKPLKVDKSLSFIGQSQILLANNPILQKDRYLNKASYQEYKQSIANFFPKVQLSAQGGQSKVQNFSTSNKKVKLMLTDASAIASWNIFNGFKDYNKARSAKVGYHAMKDNYSYDKSDLTLQLVQSELDLELYERLLANDQSNVKVHQKIWDLVSKRSKKGYDRISARKHALSRLSLAKTHVLSDEQSLSDAKVLYESLVGYKPSRILKLPEVKRSDLPVDAHMALLGASDNNLNLKSKYKSYLQSRYNSSESRSEFFPKIDLVASASHGKNIGGLEGTDIDYQAYVQVSYKILNGGADFARAKELAYKQDASFADYLSARRQLKANLENNMNRLGFMVENQKLLKTYKDELEGVVIAYQQQYKAGKRSLFDLLNMENEYYLANKNFISAKFAIKNLKYQILFDIGELSSFLNKSHKGSSFK